MLEPARNCCELLAALSSVCGYTLGAGRLPAAIVGPSMQPGSQAARKPGNPRADLPTCPRLPTA
eukprot:1333907-Alexandrium_andersonii.AAC.1